MKIKIHKDFPKLGVDFIDLNPTFLDFDERYKLISNTIESLEKMKFVNVDKVVVPESRGFLLGVHIADYFQAGLVLARKPNKLPGEIVTDSYGTEYSKDSLAIQVSGIDPGDLVFIHDDIYATGGTYNALRTLIEKLGGIVVGAHFITRVPNLPVKETDVDILFTEEVIDCDTVN